MKRSDNSSANSKPVAPDSRFPGWFDRPMRWAQLTFVENDVETNDKDFWLKYFTDTHSDAVCLSAGGVVAFYPTKIPFHYRSPWLGDRDLFGELVEGCHERNMIVVARTDSHAVHQDVFEAHPDWIAVDANGQPRRHWSSPELWVACAFGPYSLEFMTEVHRELMTMYDLDGIFTNRWDGSGMCYCEHCQKNFFEAYGMALPTKVDPKDEAWRNYTQFYQDRLFNVWKLWDSEIRKINPEARFIPNGGGGALSLLDMKTVGELSDTLFADRQGRVGLQPPWASGKDAKEFRAALGRKPVVGIFSVGLAMDGDYRWKDSVQSDAELRIWVADGIANGLRPWFTKFASSIYDKRWLKTVKDIYNWHFQSEKYLRNEKPLARVGMVYSQQTALYYGGADAKEKVEDYILGMYQALIEARVPFEMVHDLKLDMENIGQYKVLILPNIAVLSDRQCDQLRQFVRNGGSLIATLETSLYTETGEIRDDFGLADLFGTHYKEQIPGPINNSYLRLETEEGSKTFHPIIEGLGETERITNGLYFLITEPEEQSILAPLTLIPAYPDLPMEMVYPRVEKTDIPAVCLREIGDSRIVYFPWDIDRTFWEVLCVDHSKVIANAIKWAMTNEEQPVTVTGQGLMDLSIWRQKDSMTVHLVNLTNPMTMKGPFREFYPIYDQKVRIRIPEGFRVSDVKYLVSDEAAEYRIENGYVYVTVPTIMDREVLALDLEEMMK